MYGHTKTMKVLTELLDSFRGIVGQERPFGIMTNPPANIRPRNWFRPVKLFSDLGNPVARGAIIDEGQHIMDEIKRKSHDLILNNQEPNVVYLGGWEMVVLSTWFNIMHPTFIKPSDTSGNTDDDEIAHLQMDGAGHLLVKKSEAESFIEVVAKRKVTADSFL